MLLIVEAFDGDIRDNPTGADWFLFSLNDVNDAVTGEFASETGDSTV